MCVRVCPLQYYLLHTSLLHLKCSKCYERFITVLQMYELYGIGWKCFIQKFWRHLLVAIAFLALQRPLNGQRESNNLFSTQRVHTSSYNYSNNNIAPRTRSIHCYSEITNCLASCIAPLTADMALLHVTYGTTAYYVIAHNEHSCCYFIDLWLHIVVYACSIVLLSI